MRWIFLIILLAFLSAGFERSYFAAEDLTLDLSVSGTLTASYGADSTLTDLTVNVPFYPKHTTLHSQTFTPEPYEQDDDTVTFRWSSLEPSYTYHIHSTITNAFISERLRRVDMAYPLTTDHSEYTMPTELIDSDHPSITRLASELAEGEDHLLELVITLADHVRETIEYNLSTINIEANFPASEVLARKEGVCAEITVLFIALNRALGIPARYVSGYAYTDIFTPEGSWEGHGWAEVYIDGRWIPFDLTYGEYLHVNPARIAFLKGDDPASTRYRWRSRGVEISSQPIEVDVNVIDEGEPLRFAAVHARPVHERVGESSYNAILVGIENTKDYAIAPRIELSAARGVDVITPKQFILLGPREEQTIPFLVRVDTELDPAYHYTFPFIVQGQGFPSIEGSFTADTASAQFRREDFPIEDRRRSYTEHVSIICETAEVYPRASEQEAACTIRNLGNRNYDRLEICIESCEEISLRIRESVEVTLPFWVEESQERIVRVKGDQTLATETFSYEALSPAQVTVHTEQIGARMLQVGVESTEQIEGTLSIRSNAREIAYAFRSDGFVETVELPYAMLTPKETRFEVILSYTDALGTHRIEEEAVVEMEDSLLVRLRIFFARLFS